MELLSLFDEAHFTLEGHVNKQKLIDISQRINQTSSVKRHYLLKSLQPGLPLIPEA